MCHYITLIVSIDDRKDARDIPIYKELADLQNIDKKKHLCIYIYIYIYKSLYHIIIVEEYMDQSTKLNYVTKIWRIDIKLNRENYCPEKKAMIIKMPNILGEHFSKESLSSSILIDLTLKLVLNRYKLPLSIKIYDKTESNAFDGPYENNAIIILEPSTKQPIYINTVLISNDDPDNKKSDYIEKNGNLFSLDNLKKNIIHAIEDSYVPISHPIVEHISKNRSALGTSDEIFKTKIKLQNGKMYYCTSTHVIDTALDTLHNKLKEELKLVDINELCLIVNDMSGNNFRRFLSTSDNTRENMCALHIEMSYIII
jgi:hypothetical protein